MGDIDDVWDYVQDIFSWASYTSYGMGYLSDVSIPDIINKLNVLNINMNYLVGPLGLDYLKGGIDYANGVLNAFMPAIANGINQIISNLGIEFSGLYTYLGPKFTTILSQLDDLAVGATEILNTLTDLPQFFIDFLLSLMLTVKSLIETATRLIVSNITKLQAAATTTIVSMTSVVQNLIMKAINELGNSLIFLKGLLDNILITLTDSLHMVVQEIISVMSLITEAIIKSTNTVIDEGSDAAIRVFRALSSAKVTALVASLGGAAVLKVASL